MENKRKSVFELLNDPWIPVTYALNRNEFPEDKYLIAALETDDPVPSNVRKHLADVISGKKKRPRGRPKTSYTDMVNLGRSAELVIAYCRILKFLQREDPSTYHGTPSEEAFIRLQRSLASRGVHYSTGSIKNFVYEKRFEESRKELI